jgi:hypothetical protein
MRGLVRPIHQFFSIAQTIARLVGARYKRGRAIVKSAARRELWLICKVCHDTTVYADHPHSENLR